MKARECEQCGAPLPESTIDAPIICPFCGTVYDATTTIPRNLKVKLSGRRMRWIIAVAILAPILGMLVPACAGIVLATIAVVGASIGASISGRAPTTVALGLRGGLIKPSALADQKSMGWQTLDCAPPPGGAGNLEAVAAIPWALSLAQAWRGDARLYRVDADKLRADGLVNAQDDEASSVTYWFLSPSRLEEQRRQADLGQSNVKTELMLEVRSGKARAMVTDRVTHVSGLDGLPPPHPASLLPLKQILDGLERGGKLPSKPFYNGVLTYYSDTWVWQFITLSNRESIPSVRASDGRVSR